VEHNEESVQKLAVSELKRLTEENTRMKEILKDIIGNQDPFIPHYEEIICLIQRKNTENQND
jgi:hypothetical protein